MTETVPPEPQARRRAPRWMWIALVLSVALNLLVVGMAAAAMIHFRNKHTMGGRFHQFVMTLPAERRDALRGELGDRRAILRPLRRKARQARRRARNAFTAEPFDAAKLATAYAEAEAARSEVRRIRGEWFQKFATSLTVEERRAYLKWRRKNRHRHRRWRRRHSDDR